MHGELCRDLEGWAGSSAATVAILFTDIVGWTGLTARIGNEQADAILSAHYAQGRSLVAEHGGFVVKTVGDELMVLFRTSVTALDFVLAFQENPGDHRLRIRAGLHVGMVHVREGDAFGLDVSHAHRVIDCARGAEVWVSDHAKRQIDGEKAVRHRALRWEEWPDRELKGLPSTHTLWSLVAPA